MTHHPSKRTIYGPSINIEMNAADMSVDVISGDGKQRTKYWTALNEPEQLGLTQRQQNWLHNMASEVEAWEAYWNERYNKAKEAVDAAFEKRKENNHE